MKDYVKEMRELIGHIPLMVTCSGVIIENDKDEILLQLRSDNNCWCVPGGCMNIGETYIETAKREVFEETGLQIDKLSLFGIYSGKDLIIKYPNKDICVSTIVIFKTKCYSGTLLQKTDETKEHRFFSKESLPHNINKTDKLWINHWKNGAEPVIIF